MTSSTTAIDTHDAQVRSASSSVYAAFIGCGFATASWASRIPQIREHLHLSPSRLGLVLLSIAVGSILALPLSGPVIARIGSRRTVRAMALLQGLALGVAALGYLAGVAVLVAGLFLVGFATGAWDVAMNVQGAVVEQRLGRSIMSRYHAGWSLGTVAGALIGAAAIVAHVAVSLHLLAVAAVVTVVVVARVRHFIGDHDVAGTGPADAPPPDARGSLNAWREPRTLLIGAVVLGFAFAEGTGNDWISVAVIDGYGLPAALGTLAFAVFLAAMTAVRWFGPGLLDRYGRVRVVCSLALAGIVGLLLFVFAPTAPLAFVGTLLWGAGTALGFPVGMSAGADEPRLAAGRVSVISSIGYCAFLAGPPLIGFLGDAYTVLRALTAVAVLLGVSALLTGVLKAPTTDPSAAAESGLPSGQ